MKESIIKTEAIYVIQSIQENRNNNNNDEIIVRWKKLVSHLNQIPTFEGVPDCQEVTDAMYLYVMKLYSKSALENAIRAFTTFWLLKRSIDNSSGSQKTTNLIHLTMLLSNYLRHFTNVNYHAIFPLASSITTENPSGIVKAYNNVDVAYDALKLYLKNEITNCLPAGPVPSELMESFENDSTKFSSRLLDAQYPPSFLPDGKDVLDYCYRGMIKIGKCPIFVPTDESKEIYRSTKGLIPNDFVFKASSFFLRESNGRMGEGDTDAKFIIKMENGFFSINTIGISDEYIRPNLKQMVTDTWVQKADQKIQYHLKHHVEKIGDNSNMPLTMTFYFEKFQLSIIELDFVTGYQGVLRTIQFYGTFQELAESTSDNITDIIGDFNFDLDNTIDYEIKEKYLPVRAMTAENMGVLGDVAIVGCNPIRYHDLGSITTSDFEIVENGNTEYFVFSKYSPLYNDLVRRIHSMDSWIPEIYAYYTIKGWVHGALRIVHIDNSLY